MPERQASGSSMIIFRRQLSGSRSSDWSMVPMTRFSTHSVIARAHENAQACKGILRIMIFL